MDESGTKPNFQPAQGDAAKGKLNRRSLLLGGATLAGSAIAPSALLQIAQGQVQMPAQSSAPKPNILVIFGDDVGIANISAYSNGLMGYETPNIDRIAREGMKFLHYYGEQSCTAGRAAFLTSQHGIRSGLTKVGYPGGRWECARPIRRLAVCSKT